MRSAGITGTGRTRIAIRLQLERRVADEETTTVRS